ncbi:MAG: hypothetical protein ACTHKF_05510 [Candidatus Nitrosocosmicus sp.]
MYQFPVLKEDRVTILNRDREKLSVKDGTLNNLETQNRSVKLK